MNSDQALRHSRMIAGYRCPQVASRGAVALSDPASLLPQILRSGEPEPPASLPLADLNKLGVVI